uniref:Uncharacterized protein n=1 Tax=Leersia perrieri TaxID=77586 RepID=A0A0D9X3C2_9ORYZ
MWHDIAIFPIALHSFLRLGFDFCRVLERRTQEAAVWRGLRRRPKARAIRLPPAASMGRTEIRTRIRVTFHSNASFLFMEMKEDLRE